jgi:hypothetical protein
VPGVLIVKPLQEADRTAPGKSPIHGAEAGRDPFAITAILEHAAPKLLAPAADDVFRVALAVRFANSRTCDTDTALGLLLKLSMPIICREWVVLCPQG